MGDKNVNKNNDLTLKTGGYSPPVLNDHGHVECVTQGYEPTGIPEPFGILWGGVGGANNTLPPRR